MTTWKAIPEHTGYEVSDNGQVRSVDRDVPGPGYTRKFKGKLLSVFPDKNGYMRVGLGRGTTQKHVARLMLLAFVGEPPEGKEQARHIDGNPSNNVLSNLLWGDTSENTLDQVQHGTHHYSRRTCCKRGHEYTPENLGAGSFKNGKGRICLKCKSESETKRLADPEVREKKNAPRRKSSSSESATLSEDADE